MASVRSLLAPAVVFVMAVSLIPWSERWLGDLPGPYGSWAVEGMLGIAGLAVIALASRLVAQVVLERLSRRRGRGPVPLLLRRLVSAAIWGVGLMVLASVLYAFPISRLWAATGVLSVVLGLALRNVILDVFTGIAVNLDGIYQIGDWIEVHDNSGNVEFVGQVSEIDWRTTRLRTEQNNTIVVPNSLLSATILTNYSEPSEPARFQTEFWLDYTVPVQRAVRVLSAAAREAATAQGFVAEKPPQVLVNRTGELGVEYRIRYWIRPWQELSPSRSRSHLNEVVLAHLEHSGLRLAYPKEEVLYDRRSCREMDDESDRAHLLRRVELFRVLNGDEARALADEVRIVDLEAGEAMVRRGEAGDSMFVVVEGLLDVRVAVEDGAEVSVGHLRPGDFCGEMSVLAGEPRSATVVAKTHVVAFEIMREQIQRLMTGRPELAEELAVVVAARHSANVAKLAQESEVEAGNDSQVRAMVRRIKAWIFSAK